LQSLLADFLDKSQATFSLVIDRGGAILCQQGSLSGSIDFSILAALAAGSFAAPRNLPLVSASRIQHAPPSG